MNKYKEQNIEDISTIIFRLDTKTAMTLTQRGFSAAVTVTWTAQSRSAQEIPTGHTAMATAEIMTAIAAAMMTMMIMMTAMTSLLCGKQEAGKTESVVPPVRERPRESSPAHCCVPRR